MIVYNIFFSLDLSFVSKKEIPVTSIYLSIYMPIYPAIYLADACLSTV